jgi:GH24 family phage-related lysozyme (muramidase)
MFGKIIKHMERTGIVRKSLKKSAPKPVKHKLEGSNNVTLATEFQQPIQIKESPSQTQSPATSALPQSRTASRRNLSLLQRKSLDSTEYEKPDNDLVSFEHKGDHLDYEYDASRSLNIDSYVKRVKKDEGGTAAIKHAYETTPYEVQVGGSAGDFSKGVKVAPFTVDGVKKYPPYLIRGEKEYTRGYGDYGTPPGRKHAVSEKEMEVDLKKNIRERLPKIIKKIPKFHSLSQNLKDQVVSSWFRGGLGGSPDTIKLINQGKFKDAAIELIDHDEYRESYKKKTGVYKRMDRFAAALRKE